ncbi:Csp1 family four helix bundle copper storage protein [Pseudobacteriovorax antillogorgiicola]|uniref:Twin-arginine translocation signal/Cys-rich four helix bundle protein n=1 Tax=Pseudobacteriovorax antillogorgiicola TaxID=1513793 RepID=A0A1Y6BGU1_9BACT|nr:Csp1 family four helix bundle copper storage protein [Pseudobacteriovorax antillogorgiicola]TCS57329.1 Cys-rich four helix bundle protein (predicted Tat secretion target) [Pseudobacteriovorax antillogorgiicola]SMF02444.1 twin-arginine translocation signal/Cys-rich four helix bundle protein [Pseudobacteriovorax antillogorgiicola]
MDRRTFVAGAGALAGTVASSTLMAKNDHHHHHGKSRVWTKAEKNLVSVGESCVSSGKICTSHCIDQLMSGNTKMAECHQSVLNMTEVVQTMVNTIIHGGGSKKSQKALAETCILYCEDCKKSCEVHVKHHKECKDCAESCDECIKACQMYLKA